MAAEPGGGAAALDATTTPSIVRAFAPAKINLYLHVVGRRADGYHLLDSLIAFADIGDRITAAPADTLTLNIDGPESGALGATVANNLVMRAARLLADTMPEQPRGASLRLEKALPVSSGIGGGSSDAAATLRALFRLWRHKPDEHILAELALRLGADTPACLMGTPVWISGIGEELEAAPGLPATGIVLANPRVALSTPAVFKARVGGFSAPGRFCPMPRDSIGLAQALAASQNDITAAACILVPDIRRVLETLGTLPGALLSRMSGSGATCFALFADRAGALEAGAVLRRREPSWWSAAGALTSGPPDVDSAA